jgi:hypothetical protein
VWLRRRARRLRGRADRLAQQPTFRAGTEIVPVLTTVTDADGRLVPYLDREHFTLLDNGRPQEITVFQNDVQPFTVVVMLDFSASMTEHLACCAAAEQFIIRILPHDRAQVGRSATRSSSAAPSRATATT